MKLIQCKLGAAQPYIAGQEYRFERDQADRYVCRVDNDDHANILLAVEHYIVVPELPALALFDTAPFDAGAAERAAREQAEAQARAEQEAAERTAREQEAAEADAKAREAAEAAERERNRAPPVGLGQPDADEPFDDDTMRIKGIGATMKEKLAALGIKSLHQIAAFDENTIAALDEQLNLRGAIARNEWVQQAQAMLPADREPTE